MERVAIFGPPGSGKAGRIVRAVLDGAERPGGSFLVVPSLVDRSRFLRELAGSGKTLLDIEVGTWSALVQRIAAAPVRRPDAAMERVLARQALERSSHALGDSLRWRGFAETARHHILALRRAAVWGGDARVEAIANLPGGDVDAWESIVETYSELLRERRLYDDAWLERRMRQRIDAGELGVGAVISYQTLAPTRLQVRMLEAVGHHVPVTAALPWRGGRGLHDAVARLREHWVGSGWHVEATSRSSSDDVLEWFASELFESSPSTPPVSNVSGPLSVGFVECSGPRQEAEEVAAEVGRLLAEGVPIGSIAVVAANPDRDSPLVQAAFRRAGIPLAAMVARRAPDVPAGRMLRDTLAAVEADDPSALIASLGGSSSPVSTRTHQLADAGLRGATGIHTIAEALELRAVSTAVPKELRALVEAAGAPGSDVLGATLDHVATLRPPDEGSLRLFKALATVLESLAAAAGSRTDVRLSEIVAAVEDHRLQVPDRVDSGSVVLARILDLGTARFDAVVVFGLHHGGFTASAERDEEIPAAARDLAHLAVTRARRALRFVRQHTDSGGGAVAPHTVWLELERLARMLPPGSASWRERGLGAVVPSFVDIVFAADVPVAIARALANGDVVTNTPAHAAMLLERGERVLPRLVVDGITGERLADLKRIAATELEQFQSCPVQWLLRKEHPLSDLDGDRTSAIAGIYAHDLLQFGVPSLLTRRESGVSPEQVVGEIRAASCQRVRVEGVVREHDLLRTEDQVVELMRGEIDPARTKPLESWYEVQLDSAADGVQDPDLPPSIPPWPSHGLDIGGVEVHGRVDRIDRFDDGLVLHDYKSGAKTPSPAQLVDDRNLQLGIYWLAIERTADAPRPIAAPYRALPLGGKPWGYKTNALVDIGMIRKANRPIDDDKTREMLDETETVVRRVIDQIRAGDLDIAHIDPDDRHAPCGYCSLRAICRIDERTGDSAADPVGNAEEVGA